MSIDSYNKGIKDAMERGGDAGWCEHLHDKGPSPTPFLGINCARDALKTASNGHWRLKRQADSTVKTC